MVKFKFSSPIFKVINKDIEAVTLFNTIHFRNKEEMVSKTLIRHEMIHIEQIKKEGALKFYFNYLLQYLKNRMQGMNHKDAYLNISYEIEAYKKTKVKNL